jgi:hypothetical protein
MNQQVDGILLGLLLSQNAANIEVIPSTLQVLDMQALAAVSPEPDASKDDRVL